jgi:hypothetical protein
LQYFHREVLQRILKRHSERPARNCGAGLSIPFSGKYGAIVLKNRKMLTLSPIFNKGKPRIILKTGE